MTSAETEADIGRMVLAYEQLARKRACLRRRIREHGDNLTKVLHAFGNWDTSTHAKEVDGLLKAANTDAMREDAASLAAVEAEIAQTEGDLQDAGITSVQSGRRG